MQTRSKRNLFLCIGRSGFHDAVYMVESSQDKVMRIAEYCLANRDREIPRAELVANCDIRNHNNDLA
jgi:hypothetical protein